VLIQKSPSIETPILRYDEDADILYVKFFDSRGTTGKDIDEFCVVFPKNDQISAAIIYGFGHLSQSKPERIIRYQELLSCTLSLDLAEILPQ